MKMSTGASIHGRARFIEQSWILIGKQTDKSWRFRRRCESSGNPALVEAAWEWALRREELYGDVVGFFHTHPHGATTQPSYRDILTMRAWCSALGKPLLCLIAEGNDIGGCVFDNAGGQLKAVESIQKRGKGWYLVQGRDR